MRGLVWLCLLISLAGPSAAQEASQQFIRPEVAPKSPTTGTCALELPAAVPVRCWKGLKFVVLPVDPLLRNYGYQLFRPEGGGIADGASYEELAGKIVTITSVVWHTEDNPILKSLNGWEIGFRADDNGRSYITKATQLPTEGPDEATVDHLALLRDLSAAKSMWAGKSYFITVGRLPKLGQNGQMVSSDWVHFRKYLPVRVVDVLASSDIHNPVRVVVANDAGEEAYLDVEVSTTNAREREIPRTWNFGTYLSADDPKLAHKWDARVWNAIEDGKVYVGMTAEQAKMSWGEPHEVNRTTVGNSVREQWVYEENNYLYVSDGRVSGIQN
jgi:hypothetical protein